MASPPLMRLALHRACRRTASPWALTLPDGFEEAYSITGRSNQPTAVRFGG